MAQQHADQEQKPHEEADLTREEWDAMVAHLIGLPADKEAFLDTLAPPKQLSLPPGPKVPGGG